MESKNFKGPEGQTFSVQRKLGEGAFGSVYLAKCSESGREVAVKVLRTGGESDLLALSNDIQHASQVDHENVVAIIHGELGKNGKESFLMMEYVDGGTLKDLLDGRKQQSEEIALPEAIGLMKQIALGMSAINEKIIHRDLKPDNILVAGDCLKISDFGISKLINEETRTQTFKGCQHLWYRAPESWKFETNSFKIDIYSAGLVFFEILTLRHPVAEFVENKNHPEQWMRAHLFEHISDLKAYRQDLPIQLSQLISSMIEKRPEDRPTWDTVISVLDAISSQSDASEDSRLARAAMAGIQKQREEMLLAQKLENKENEARLLYQSSCAGLLKNLDRVVDSFNQNFHQGKIRTTSTSKTSRVYRLPTGENVEVSFFPPQGVADARRGNIIGGGYIGSENGIGANLVLRREHDEDLYGDWSMCFMGVSALVDNRKIVGKYGLYEGKPVPFGFEISDDFYNEIQYAGIMHIFTYDFEKNLVSGFERILESAFNPPVRR